MKKILFIAFLFVSVFANAQESSVAQKEHINAKDSKSKAVQFMERDGAFLKKEFYYLGTIKGVASEVIITTDLKNNEKIGCLKLRTVDMGVAYIGFLDTDELSAAIQSLEYVKDEVLPSKASTYTEVLYKSRDNVVMGAYTFANGFNDDYKWRVFVKPNDYDGSFEDFSKKHIENFIDYLKRAQSIISEKTKQ